MRVEILMPFQEMANAAFALRGDLRQINVRVATGYAGHLPGFVSYDGEKIRNNILTSQHPSGRTSYVPIGYVDFERDADAVMFKLQWSDEFMIRRVEP